MHYFKWMFQLSFGRSISILYGILCKLGYDNWFLRRAVQARGGWDFLVFCYLNFLSKSSITQFILERSKHVVQHTLQKWGMSHLSQREVVEKNLRLRSLKADNRNATLLLLQIHNFSLTSCTNNCFFGMFLVLQQSNCWDFSLFGSRSFLPSDRIVRSVLWLTRTS